MSDLRVVVTGHEDDHPVFRSDGAPDHVLTMPGATVWRLLRLDGVPRSVDDGVPQGGPPPPLPPGGISVQVMELTPRDKDEWPDGGGWRQAPSLDLTVVIDGELVLGLEEAEVRLGPGDALVQRGTTHRMRAGGGRPMRALVTHLAPSPERAPADLLIRAGTDGSSGVRRVVTGVDHAGRSTVVADGEPGDVFRPGASVLTDVWQTGGPLASVEQGGDVDGVWQVEPRDGGVKLGIIELPPGDYTADANWHTTATIDVDVILSGGVELHLPEIPPVVLGPGDVIVQRGTHHRWQPVGDEPLRMAAVMLALQP